MRAGLRSAVRRHARLGVFAIVATAVLSGLVLGDIITPLVGLVGAIAAALAILAAALTQRFRRERRASAAIDFVATRLLSVESRLSALDRTTQPDRVADLDEVLADVSLLSELVKSLAEAMSVQDGEIAALKARLDRSVPEQAPPLPSPAFLQPASKPVRQGERAVRDSEAHSASVLHDPHVPAAETAPRAVTSADNPHRVVPSLLPLSDGHQSRERREPDAAGTALPEARGAAILQALASERVELHLQPIVTLPQRSTRFYGVTAALRLADETLVASAEFLPTLERAGRAADMDRQIVARALTVAAHLVGGDPDLRLSCAISAASLADRGVASRLADMLAGQAPAASRLILELTQGAWRNLSAEVEPELARLRSLGVAFAMDGATDLRLEGIALGSDGVTLVKLPAALLLGAIRPGDDPGPIAQLQPLLAQHGVHIVAERVEREADIPDLIDLGILLAQGNALGAARALRADLPFAPSPHQPLPAVAPEAAPSPAAGAASPPFRSFLRRTG